MSNELNIIGELMNNSFARACRAWKSRDLRAYQELARLQVARGANFLTVNLDGTQSLNVHSKEMLDFLPQLVPALQDAVDVPLSLDNPSTAFHRTAFKHYDRSKGAPILNSVAASRVGLQEMMELVRVHDTRVIVMASERFVTNEQGESDSVQCLTAQDAYQAARYFVRRLQREADRSNDQIIIDPGLAPVGADTYGLVNVGLDAMRLIRNDPEMAGVHLSVGLTNFSWGVPKEARALLERAYLTLAMEAGLDFVLGNPEKDLTPLEPKHPAVCQLREALEEGRPKEGESQEEAGYRQAESIMELCMSRLD